MLLQVQKLPAVRTNFRIQLRLVQIVATGIATDFYHVRRLDQALVRGPWFVTHSHVTLFHSGFTSPREKCGVSTSLTPLPPHELSGSSDSQNAPSGARTFLS